MGDWDATIIGSGICCRTEKAETEATPKKKRAASPKPVKPAKKSSSKQEAQASTGNKLAEAVAGWHGPADSPENQEAWRDYVKRRLRVIKTAYPGHPNGVYFTIMGQELANRQK